MITLKINVAMNGFKAGSTITLAADLDGNILDDFWSRRLKDAERDNCVEIFQQPKPIKGSKNADFTA